jgi:hypothetical protein
MAQGSGSEKMKWEKVGIDTISTLILVESAGSFGDGRCCHPSGYLEIDGTRLPADGATSSRLQHAPQSSVSVPTGLVALSLLTRSLQARLALSGPAIAGSIQAFPKALYCLAHHQNPFADSSRLIE